MLLFDESKKLEQALGSEGAAVIAHILERQAAEQSKREQETLASKHDIALLQKDIALVRQEMLELEVRLRHDLTLRLGGIMAASVGIMAAVVKILG